MAMTNRLHALTRTLGSDYFSVDVMEPAVLSGEDPVDPNATKDVTPERFLRMEKELVRGKADIVSFQATFLLMSNRNFVDETT